MKFDCRTGDRGIVHDADGNVLPWPVAGNTENGLVLCQDRDANGKLIITNNEEVKLIMKRFKPPLAIHKTNHQLISRSNPPFAEEQPMIQNEQQCLDLIREEQQRINLIRKEGRYRRLLINGRDIIMLFRGMKNSLYAAIPPDRYDGCSCLPENCIIEEWSLAMDSFPRSLSIVIGHESFDPIEEGAILPNYQCQCKRRLVPVTDDPDVVIEDSSHE